MRILLSITLLILTFAFGAVSYLGSAETLEVYVRATDPAALIAKRAMEIATSETERMVASAQVAAAETSAIAQATTARLATETEIAAIHTKGAAEVSWQVYTETLAEAYGNQALTAVAVLSKADDVEVAFVRGMHTALSTIGAHLIYGAGQSASVALSGAEMGASFAGSTAYSLGKGAGETYEAGANWLGNAERGFENAFKGTTHTKKVCVEKSDGTEFCADGDALEDMLGAE